MAAEEIEPCLEPAGNRTETNEIVPKDSKKTKRLLFASTVLCVGLICLNILTYVYMITESRNIERQTNLCMKCSHMKLHPDDDLSNFEVFEGSDSCCLKANGSYSQLVDKLIDRNMKMKLLSESRPYRPLHCAKVKPAIKLVGKSINHADPQTTRFQWLKWDLEFYRVGDNKRGFLIHDDTYIEVKSSGIYQIYSQISLENKQSEEPSAYSTSSDRYYVHAVYRQSGPGHDERLLGGSYTYFQNKDGKSAITSYVSSPFQLIGGDKIGVKVHDTRQVMSNNLTNFFGLHLIE